MAITANKLLGKKERGGALAVRPTTSLVSYKGLESSDIQKSESDNLGKTLFTIQKKIILVDDLLKGTFAEKKKRQKDEVKQKEDEARAEEESKLEDKDTDDEEEGLKVKMPRLSFLDGIKKFIGDVLMGWLTFRLIKFLPQVMKAAKFLGRIADFLINVGGALFNGLVTFIDWGYKAVEWTRGAVENVFGEEGAKTFDKITGVLNKVLNLQLALTLAMIAFSVEFSGGLMNWGKNFMSIFKYGLKRAGTRLLIKLLGKKAAVAILGKGAVATATTATAATATTATTATAATTSTAATAGGVGVAGATGIVAGVGLLASGLGEGAYQLTKMGDGFVEYWEKSYKEKNRFDPRKVIDFGILQIMKVLNLGLGNLGVLLDIVGAPFRYLVELIRYPFLDDAGKAKQRGNLAKFDARIRDQFRKTLNFFTFGLGFKEEGSFGSLYGKEGTEGMGYNETDEVKDTKKGEVEGNTPPPPKTNRDEVKTPPKINKTFKMGKKEYDLSKLQGGLSREEYNALSNKDRGILDRRLRMYASQNPKGNVENIIPLDVNSVAKKTNNISSYDEEEETIVIKPGSETGGDVVPETETKESITPVSVGGGGGDSEVSDALYKSG